MAFALTAVLKGPITIRDGRVEQGNFHHYPLLRLDEMPAVEVHIVPSNEPPGGISEPGVPPFAPAVVNAVYAATAKGYAACLSVCRRCEGPRAGMAPVDRAFAGPRSDVVGILLAASSIEIRRRQAHPAVDDRRGVDCCPRLPGTCWPGPTGGGGGAAR